MALGRDVAGKANGANRRARASLLANMPWKGVTRKPVTLNAGVAGTNRSTAQAYQPKKCYLVINRRTTMPPFRINDVMAAHGPSRSSGVVRAISVFQGKHRRRKQRRATPAFDPGRSSRKATSGVPRPTLSRESGHHSACRIRSPIRFYRVRETFKSGHRETDAMGH